MLSLPVPSLGPLCTYFFLHGILCSRSSLGWSFKPNWNVTFKRLSMIPSWRSTIHAYSQTHNTHSHTLSFCHITVLFFIALSRLKLSHLFIYLPTYLLICCLCPASPLESHSTRAGTSSCSLAHDSYSVNEWMDRWMDAWVGSRQDHFLTTSRQMHKQGDWTEILRPHCKPFSTLNRSSVSLVSTHLMRDQAVISFPLNSGGWEGLFSPTLLWSGV